MNRKNKTRQLRVKHLVNKVNWTQQKPEAIRAYLDGVSTD